MNLRRTITALLLVGTFTASLGGTASAAPVIQLDLLGLLGLRQPVQAPALPNAAPPPVDPPPAVAPAVPAASGAGRRVVYSVGTQRVWLVNEDESVHGTWLVSGRAGEPAPGSYAVFSRSRNARAKAAGVSMEFMVRFARTPGLPIGFHSIPVNRRGVPIQTVEKLGSYQSLGCVRQRYEDAAVMWEFAQLGTPVIVVA